MASGIITQPYVSNTGEIDRFVDLVSSGYTSENPYTAPSNGFITVALTSAEQDGYVAIFGNITNTVYMRLGGAIGRYTTYVPKGIRMYVTGTVQLARYLPLS